MTLNTPQLLSKRIFVPGSIASLCILTMVLLTSQSGFAAGVGDVAPAFELQTSGGESVSLADYRGKKAVYLVFWNTWCNYCIKKTPRYIKLAEEFSDRIEVIAINTTWSDTEAQIEQFQEQHKTNYQLVYDAGEVVTRRYVVQAVPTEFIIDIDGIIRYRDGVPKYVAAHIPDWFQPYTADMNPLPSCANPDAL